MFEIGDRFEGSVLDLVRLPVPIIGLGVVTECFEDTDTFRRIPPCFLIDSAAALPFDGCRSIVFVRGVDIFIGVDAFRSNDAASSYVPRIPNKK